MVAGSAEGGDEVDADGSDPAPRWWEGAGLRAFLAQDAVAVGCFDRALRHVAVSPALERLNGRPASELLGRTPVEVNGDAVADAEASYARVLATGEPIIEQRFTSTTRAAPDDERHWLLDVLPVPGAEGPDGSEGAVGAVGVIVLVRDVTDMVRADRLREAASDVLVQRAHTDPLTGLANRAAIFAELEQALAGDDGITVVFCDLDGFKAVNDGHGHVAGDQVLRAVARRIRHAARAEDLAARFGGDEFIVLVRRRLDRKTLDELIHRYRTAIAQPVYVEGVRFELDVSVGAAVARPGETADDVVRAADRRMYRAKRHQRE